MKTLLKLEMLGLFILAVFFFKQLGMGEMGLSWWWFVVLFLVPDFSMLGYMAGPKVGAWMYNFFHHFGVAVFCIIFGAWFEIPYLELAGIVMLGHSALDRTLGYGLKYEDDFKHTHLGTIGK